MFFSFSEEKNERNQNYISPFAFVINMVVNLSIAVKPITVNFLQLFAVCGRTRNFLRLPADRILNFLRLELLADKVQFNFFLPLACSCSARSSCATSCACIIFGLYCSSEPNLRVGLGTIKTHREGNPSHFTKSCCGTAIERSSAFTEFSSHYRFGFSIANMLYDQSGSAKSV